jgi:hypothetical protein
MKKYIAIIARALIILLGIAVATFLLVEPHFEDRNAHATFWQVYTHDPFLWFAYASSIAFFVMLYQAFQLAGYAERNTLLSQPALKAFQTIKYCGLLLAVALIAAEIYLFVAVRGTDDITGGVAIGLILLLAVTTITTTTALFERNLQNRLTK